MPHYSKVLTLGERIPLLRRILKQYGFRGILTALKNERIFYRTILDGKLGYCLFKGVK